MSTQDPLDPATRTTVEARVGQTLCGRYTLEQVLGVGATGAVYRASHRNGNRVAVKVVHEQLAASTEAREALVRAANEANRVDHPGAVRILDDAAAEDGALILVMELAVGQTLAEVVARAGGRLAAPDVVPVVLQLLDVLAAAHAKGIVHGAVSAEKMLVSTDRSLHLLGFGTSRPTAQATAPEQASGEPASPATDVWAAGAVLFRALTGHAIHEGPTPGQPLRNVLPQVDPALAAVVDRSLAWRREDRFVDAAAMAAALRAPRPAPAPPGTYPPPPGFVMPPPADTGWVKWVVGGVVLAMMLVVLAGGAIALALRSSKAKRSTEAATTWSDAASPVPVSSKDPTWGDRGAPVTMVVFSELQCPFCKRAEPTLEQLKTTYGPTQLRIVWKNDPLPFHQNARPAARAGQAVFVLKGSAAFFRFNALAFQHQADLGHPESLRAWAVEAGADGLAFDKLLASPAALDAKIDEDLAVAKRVDATGTPSFRINGLLLSGAQPLAKFKSLIDAELPAAQAAVKAGIPRDRIYVVRSTENFAHDPAAKHEDEHEDEDDAAPPTVWRVPVDGSPVRGNVDAPVTIVEYGDFQCTYCKRAEATLDKVRDTYGDRVRIVWKNNPLPFHPRAEAAAELALEARAEKGDAAFWSAHDKLFDAQPRLEDGDLAAIGAALGLDAAKVRAAIRDRKHRKDIDRDLGDGAGGGAGRGTPTFFINGHELAGAQPFDKLKAIIDDELKKFDGQRSVAAKDWYASLMRDAKAAPDPETRHAPPVPSGVPFRGTKGAKVVIQEWADYECPFCARVEPTLEQLLKEYGDRVMLVWRDKPLPMHPEAALAAEAAREIFAQKGTKTWITAHGLFMQDQKRLGRLDLEADASRFGLDMKRFRAALDDHRHKAAVDADDAAAGEIDIAGTPSFLVNDYYLSGAQPYPAFAKLVERALAEAGAR
ncbi:MAG: Periplasmic thiol:disulfide interchange protein DsbA [Labilithrix sp.]|nr:Periplasmic thiol:disulfide interchange protein DsbA [Labilithrix sp.]